LKTKNLNHSVLPYRLIFVGVVMIEVESRQSGSFKLVGVPTNETRPVGEPVAKPYFNSVAWFPLYEHTNSEVRQS
jgi:hypothetical protein